MAAKDVRVKITAEDKTRRAFTSAKQGISGLTSSMFSLKAGIAGVLGGAGLGLMIKSVVDTSDKMQKLSISLGVSTEALSQYRLVAERSGTTMDALSLIWQRQTRRVAEAAQGTGEAKDAIKELGIEAEELNKLSPDRQFEAIAEAMEGVEHQSDKLRLAFKLFDSEGARPALQAMAEGAEGIRAMRDEADAMGLTLTRVQADQMAEFNDRMGDIKLASSAAVQQLVVSLGPALIDIANAFVTATRQVQLFVDSFRDIEDRTNLDGLREDMLDLIDDQRELSRELAAGFSKSGIPVEVLEKRLVKVKTEINEINDRMLQLQTAAPAAIEGFQFTPGGLPTAGEEAKTEKAEQEQQRLESALARKVEAIRASNMTELELENQKALDKQFVIEDAFQLGLLGDAERKVQVEALEDAHQKKLSKIANSGELSRAKFARQTTLQRVQTVGNEMIDTLSAVSQGNKKLFAIMKVARISTAIIDAYAGASRTLATYPWPIGPVLAALHLAAGLANVSQIASATFGGSSGGGGANFSSGGAVPTFPADPLTGAPGTSTNPQPVQQSVTINVGDDSLLDKTGVRNLIEKINEAIDDGVVIGSIQVA